MTYGGEVFEIERVPVSLNHSPVTTAVVFAVKVNVGVGKDVEPKA